MSAAARCSRIEPNAVLIAVRLTPRASRDAIEGLATLSDGRAVVLARVRAVPEKGAANRALTDLLARALAVPRSAAEVVGGAGARLKQVRITADPAAVIAALDALLAAAS